MRSRVLLPSLINGGRRAAMALALAVMLTAGALDARHQGAMAGNEKSPAVQEEWKKKLDELWKGGEKGDKQLPDHGVAQVPPMPVICEGAKPPSCPEGCLADETGNTCVPAPETMPASEAPVPSPSPPRM